MSVATGGRQEPGFKKDSSKQKQLCFDDPVLAFEIKKSAEIVRGLVVYKICSFNKLVQHNNLMINLSRRVLGKRLFEYMMKQTFYGHFVGGEDHADLKDKLELMREFGVGAILDYAVESDMPAEDPKMIEQATVEEKKAYEQPNPRDDHLKYKAHSRFNRSQDLHSARTYFYEGEEKCDENMEVFLNCIDTTGRAAKNGFAAIKVTALGRPSILLRLSEILNQTQWYFDYLVGQGASSYFVKKDIALPLFTKGIKDLGVDMGDVEIERIFNLIDENNDGTIDVIEWQNFLTPQLQLSSLFRAKPTASGDEGEQLLASLTEQELSEIENMRQRLLIISDRAKQQGVRLMVDAEQTYFQPAISRLTLDAMRMFNTESPVVFNTYQCYLNQAKNSIAIDMELARRENFKFGCKLVRGAYMEQEGLRATELGYPNPIQASYESTCENYDTVLTMVLNEAKEKGANVMVATHNENSVKHAVKVMQRLNLAPDEGKVFFGQLLGMCDAVTYALGQAGYSAYKYVPYGPVEEVMPYLSRRAMENRSLMDGVIKERNMLWSELTRRFKSGELKHEPKSAFAGSS